MHFRPLGHVPRFVLALRRAPSPTNSVNCFIAAAASPLLETSRWCRNSSEAGRCRKFATAAANGGYSYHCLTKGPDDRYTPRSTIEQYRARSASNSKRSSNKYLKPSVFSRHCSYQRNMCRATALEGLAEGSSSSAKVTSGRDVLPTNVKPTHYDLILEPNLETFEFRGEVVIE